MTSALRVVGICVALLVAVNVSQGAAQGEEQGYLGVQIKLNANGGGIVIIGLEADAAGEKGGLKENDIILTANGNKLVAIKDFVDAVRDTKPGETIVLAIVRGATEMELKVKVGKKPAP